MQSQGLRISPNGQLEFPKILKQSLFIQEIETLDIENTEE